MKPRERMIAALSLKQPDDFVPVWEIEFHLFDKFSSRKMIHSTEYTKLTKVEQEKALYLNAEIMVEVALNEGLCGLSNIGGYWEVAPGHPAPMWLPPEDSAKFLSILKKTAGDDIFIFEWCQAMILIPEADDYVEFAYTLYDQPEKVDEMAREKYTTGMEIAKRARDAGADGLCAACDIADTRGQYFTKEQLDRFFLPYLRKWSSEVDKLGLKSVLHTDGNIVEILEDIASSGINGLQSIDPIAGMDILKVKDQIGDRVCLCGNIDLGLLQNGPVEAITEQTKKVCQHCKTGGGFALGATNAVFEEIPSEHYRAMIRAGREYGSYVSES
jgi:uroporphyrinogen decarboxylase